MNTKALYKLTYGVYLLTAREDGRDNGCIINTAVQVANQPARISIAVIKGNLTHDMIAATGRCNLSAITTEANFSLFQQFGMQSGRSVDKFADFPDVARSANGLYYLTKWANAFFSLRVTEVHDLGSHTLFVGELTDGEVLSAVPSCSYGYYQGDIKPKAAQPAARKGWRCTVCGYLYEGEALPEHYLCPICKHGPEDFEPVSAAPAAPADKKWVCTVCGYVHEGETAPEKCPICRVPAEKFVEMAGSPANQ